MFYQFQDRREMAIDCSKMRLKKQSSLDSWKIFDTLKESRRSFNWSVDSAGKCYHFIQGFLIQNITQPEHLLNINHLFLKPQLPGLLAINFNRN